MTKKSAPQLNFYDENLKLYHRLLDEAKYVLNSEIDFKVHSIPGRVKERTSVQNKLVDRDYVDPANDMTDLVGIRIISLFESDLRKADRAVKKAFQVISTENKIEEAADDTFGYMSIHYICMLKAEHQGPRYDGLHGLKFEVQSRTILMDAWANVSHYLAYKGKNSIPEEKQRAFYALAGLFYVADKQFEQLLVGSPYPQNGPFSAPAKPEDEQALDRDRVLAVIEQVFPGRDVGDHDEEEYLASMSDFVQEATAANIKTVGELRTTLEKGKAGALQYEVISPPNGESGSRFTAVGMSRAAAGIANSEFAALRGPRLAAKYARFRNSLNSE